MRFWTLQAGSHHCGPLLQGPCPPSMSCSYSSFGATTVLTPALTQLYPSHLLGPCSGSSAVWSALFLTCLWLLWPAHNLHLRTHTCMHTYMHEHTHTLTWHAQYTFTADAHTYTHSHTYIAHTFKHEKNTCAHTRQHTHALIHAHSQAHSHACTHFTHAVRHPPNTHVCTHTLYSSTQCTPRVQASALKYTCTHIHAYSFSSTRLSQSPSLPRHPFPHLLPLLPPQAYELAARSRLSGVFVSDQAQPRPLSSWGYHDNSGPRLPIGRCCRLKGLSFSRDRLYLFSVAGLPQYYALGSGWEGERKIMVIFSPGSLWGRIRSCFRDIISAAVEREVLLTCVSDEHHRRGSHWVVCWGGGLQQPSAVQGEGGECTFLPFVASSFCLLFKMQGSHWQLLLFSLPEGKMQPPKVAETRRPSLAVGE